MEQAWSTFVAVMRSFQVADALDVILVTFLLYKTIQFVRKTRSAQFVKAILVVIALWAVSYYLQLHMMMTVMNNFLQFGVLALLVLFQPELRTMLENIGRSKVSKFFSSNLLNRTDDEQGKALRKCISAVVEASSQMSKTKTGALMVFERHTPLDDIVATGTVLDAEPSVQMIGNIFFNKAPLHDGAMILRNGKLLAAGCILPLTKRVDVDPSLGTRHRAALGMSEHSDAVIVVVSEETGQISLVLEGAIVRDFTRETISDELESLLLPKEEEERRSPRHPFRKEGKRK